MPPVIKPLNQITKRPSNTSSAEVKSSASWTESPEPVVRGSQKTAKTTPASIDNYEPHSRHGAARSQHYHEIVIGDRDTGQFGDRAIADLNPTRANSAIRSFPGLAN